MDERIVLTNVKSFKVKPSELNDDDFLFLFTEHSGSHERTCGLFLTEEQFYDLFKQMAEIVQSRPRTNS